MTGVWRIRLAGTGAAAGSGVLAQGRQFGTSRSSRPEFRSGTCARAFAPTPDGVASVAYDFVLDRA